MDKQLLEYTGSLLLDSKFIVSPYGVGKFLPQGNIIPLQRPIIHNNAINKLTIDYSHANVLTIVNGMGVTLGDSVIGISALHAIKCLNPSISICVIRPEHCPDYVNDVYYLASNVINDVYFMPYDISRIKDAELTIDMGNQLYWDDFNVCEMHDFFIKNLGVNPDSVCSGIKSNSWLMEVDLEPLVFDDYVLLCPNASTKIRSIPSRFHHQIVSELGRAYGMKVVGFVDVMHDNYTNVSSISRNTTSYMSIIKHAKHVYTCDSSALHIAAGFNVPTTGIFTTIRPVFRSKYYKNCHSIYIGNRLTEGVHNSDDALLLKSINKEFEEFYA